MNRDDIIKQALVKLDEIGLISQQEDFSPSAIIDSVMNESTLNMLRNAPLHLLTPIKVDTEGENFIHQSNEDGTGYIILPANFARLYSFKMRAWGRPTEKAISVANPLYKLQHNPITRGKSNKPVVAVNYFNDTQGVDDPNLPIDPPVNGWNALAPIYIEDETIYHGSLAGQRHIPAGGELRQILAFGGASGVANWSYFNADIHGQLAGGQLHALATPLSHGFMSLDDKDKLNSIQRNANYYVHPMGQGWRHLPQGGAQGNIIMWSSPGIGTWVDPSNLFQQTIPQGEQNEFYSWDKTWRQIDYSMIANTPAAVDLSNYVTLDTDQTIQSNKKIIGATELINVDGVTIKAVNDAGADIIRIRARNRVNTIGNEGVPYTHILETAVTTENRIWTLPDKSGTIALTTDIDNSKWAIGQVGTAPYIIRNGTVVIGLPPNANIQSTDGLVLRTTSSTARPLVITNENGAIVSYIQGNILYSSGMPIYAGVLYANTLGVQNGTTFASFTVDNIGSHSINFKLPLSHGTSGQVLTTNGAGVWSWSTVTGGDPIPVFNNTVDGLVPAPNISDSTTKVLSYNGSQHSWITLSEGVTTRLRLNSGAYRTGDLTLASVAGNPVYIVENTAGIFTIGHDTVNVTPTTSTNYNVVSGINIDDSGHITAISTRNLLPTNPEGKFLKDDGTWEAVSGGGITETDPFGVAAIAVSGTNTKTITITTRNNQTFSASFTDLVGEPGGGDGYISNVAWTAASGNLTFTGIGNAFNNLINLDGRYLNILESVAANRYYGTNSSGDKGWHALPSPGASYSFPQSVKLSSGNVTLENDLLNPGNNKYYGTNINGTRGWYTMPEGGGVANETDPIFTGWVGESVGNNKYYGTNAQGAKAWYNFNIVDNHALISNVHTDISVTNLTANNILLWNGTFWVNAPIPVNTDTFITSISGSGNGVVTFTRNNATTISFNFSHSHNYVHSFNGQTGDVLLTKADVENVLQGVITSHTHNYTNNEGTVTSVGVGGGIVLSGNASVNPTLSIQSHAGTAGQIGTLEIGASSIGVSLGTGSTQAAAGNHTHAQLHNRQHSITSTDDHTATPWRVLYSDTAGLKELALGVSDSVLTSIGTSNAPTFKSFYSFNVFSYSQRGLVPSPEDINEDLGASENRFLCADGQWKVPAGGGGEMTNIFTQTGQLLYGTGQSNYTVLNIGSQDQVLSVSSNGIPYWRTLSSNFILDVTGDVTIGSNQVSILTAAAITGKTGLSSGDSILGASEFLFHQSGLKKVSFTSLQKNIIPITARGQLVIGGVNGAITVLPAHTQDSIRVLSQQSSISSWIQFISTSLSDMPQTINSNNQYLRSNNGSYMLHTPAGLSAGNGIEMSAAYNTLEARTIAVKFSGTGNSNLAAHSNHTHTISAFTATANRVIGRRPGANGIMEELVIASNASVSTNGLSINEQGQIAARLQDENLPKLGNHLDGNQKNIHGIRSITPFSVTESNLGSTDFRWNQLWVRNRINIGTGSTYYAGDSNGSANYNIMEALKVVSPEIAIKNSSGNTQFTMSIDTDGQTLVFKNVSGSTKVKIFQSGNIQAML